MILIPTQPSRKPAVLGKRAWHQQVKRAPASERTGSDGFVYDSKAELRRGEELLMLQRAGQISGLERQPGFPIVINTLPVKIRSAGFPNGRPAVYHADFSYIDSATDKRIVEEVKGMDSAESRLRRAIVEAIYGIEIIVTGDAARKTPRKRK